MARQVASLYGVLSLRDDGYRDGLERNRRETNTFSQQLRDMGGDMQQFASDMAVIAAPIGLALGVSVNASRQFTSEMANVNSIVQMGTDDAAAMRAEVLALGSQNTFGPIASASSLYSIVSAGITDTTTAMAVLNSSVDAAEAGQADLNATTAAMVSLMNSYNLGADGASFASDILARTVQTGVGSMDEFATALPQVTGLSSQFDIGLSEVAGSLSYLTTQGYSASQSSTFLRSMITTLLNPTADLESSITALGYSSGQSLLETEGLVGAYQLLSAQNGGLAGLITNSEALTGSMALTGETAPQAITDFTLGVSGATQAMGAAQAEAQGWDLLRSSLQGLAITAGNALMPVLNTMLERVTPIVLSITDWINQNPELATQILMIAGGVAIAVPVIGALGAGLAAIGTIIGLIFSPMALLIGGIALLVGWLNSREGGLIGSLNQARTAAMQLGAIALLGLRIAATAASQAVAVFFGYLNRASIAATQLGFIVRLALGAAVDWIAARFQQLQTAIDNVVNSMNTARTSASQLGQIAGAVTSGEVSVGQVWGAVTNSLGFGGARAMGGPVSGGTPYLVGENGPEIFTPGSSGSIVPNDQLGNFGNTTMQISISVNSDTYEGGRAAGQGAMDAVLEISRSRGVTIGSTG